METRPGRAAVSCGLPRAREQRLQVCKLDDDPAADAANGNRPSRNISLMVVLETPSIIAAPAELLLGLGSGGAAAAGDFFGWQT